MEKECERATVVILVGRIKEKPRREISTYWAWTESSFGPIKVTPNKGLLFLSFLGLLRAPYNLRLSLY